MSLDLFERENAEAAARIPGVTVPEPGAFTGYFRGAGESSMRTFAKAGSAVVMGAAGVARGVELLGAAHPLAMENDTRISDALFKFHDETINPAIDYWTPKPGEVGMAGEITGQLLATLPMVIASPAFAVAQLQLSTGAELVRKGVSAEKAGAVGAAQGAGFGLGIWMPILGQNLWQRLLVGGAGFNVLQGMAMRGVSGQVLEGEKVAEEFKAFDPQMLTLDVLLGLAFGSLAHLSPKQRTQGAKMWASMTEWAKDIKPSELDALATLRVAQHANADSLPGIPKTLADVEAHVQRLKTALGQLARDEPVDVSALPEVKVDVDTARAQEAEGNAKQLVDLAEEVRVEENLPRIDTVTAMRQAMDQVGPKEFESMVQARMDEFVGETLSLAEQAAEVEGVARRIVEGEVYPDVTFPDGTVVKGTNKFIPLEQSKKMTYPGTLKIPYGDELSPTLRAAEGRAAAHLEGNLEASLQRYANLVGERGKWADTEGGRLLNVDLFREIFDEYADTATARSLYSEAVHEPASAAIKRLYASRLKETPAPGTMKWVTFTAGGTGVGKTTGIRAIPELSNIKDRSHITYDTNLSGFDSGLKKITQALDAGHEVNIFFVGGDPEQAFHQALTRAMKPWEDGGGRTVPLKEHIATHIGAPATVLRLMEHFKDNGKVTFSVIDNSGPVGQARFVSATEAPEYLRILSSMDPKHLVSRLTEILDGENAKGKIDASVYRGTLGVLARGEEQVARAGVRGGPQPRRVGGEGRAGVLRPAGLDEAHRPEELPSTVTPEVDPLSVAARQVANARGNDLITVGQDAEGNPVQKTVRQYLDDTKAQIDLAAKDAKLFELAAACYLGAS